MTGTSHHGELAADLTLALDAWLQKPNVRITRALKKTEWSTTQDLFGALDLRASDLGLYRQVLGQLVGSGNIERGGGHGVPVRYRLLRALTPPGTVPVTPIVTEKPPREPGRDGEECEGWFFWRGSWRKL